MDCPAPDCHEQLKLCLQEKVPKKWLWWIVAAFGLPAVAFAGGTWYSAKSADLKFATTRAVSDHEARLRVLEDKFKGIEFSLERIETNQNEFRGDIKILLQRTVKNNDIAR